MANKPMVMWIS